MQRTALSLFTSGGVGDIAVRQAGFDILVSDEKLEDRHALFAFNFPSTCAITGDIWEQSGRIEFETRQRLRGRPALAVVIRLPFPFPLSAMAKGDLHMVW